MKFFCERMYVLVGLVSALATGLAFAGGEVSTAKSGVPSSTTNALTIPADGTVANQGYKLFLLNCAHCHGTDARGDEGPDLHGLTKSDQRLATIMQNGIKGEMPKFGAKLKDDDVRALIAFLRTLKDE